LITVASRKKQFNAQNAPKGSISEILIISCFLCEMAASSGKLKEGKEGVALLGMLRIATPKCLPGALIED
jgi:hypothetical protein